MVPGHHPADTAATGHRNTGVPVDRSSSTGRDAEGTRVAKGTITNWSAGCDTTQNGFTMTASYILGPGNEQLAELSWSGGVPTPVHTNVWAGGQLTATYSYDDPINYPAGILYFPLTDWLPGSPATGLRRWGGLGTRRALADQYGNLAQTCDSLPFGDGESCPATPTEHLFTGKERDTESGNDYFGARYYASSMGRFMSPDWSAKEDPVPYAQMDDPQSLNLYSYVRNNPLSKTDPDGHCPFCIPALAVVGGGALEGGEVGAVAGPPGIVVGVVVGAVIGGGILAYEHFHEDASAPAATPAPTATPTPDFVVTPGGTAVSTDPNRVAGSLTGAPGVTSTPTTQSGEQGTLHTGVQTANGPVDVRTMSGSKTNAPRTVITHPGTNNPKTPDGKATNDKGQSHIPSNSKIPQPPKTPQNP
jgi:RHS repeat-associated protein